MSSELSEAVRDLKSALSALRRSSEQGLPLPPLKVLRTVVESLGGDQSARPPADPQAHRLAWRRYLAGESVEITRRALRVLAWDPEVILDVKFHEYLTRRGMILGATGLQGLVRACHLGWPKLMRERVLLRRWREQLLAYDGTNRILVRWKENLPLVLAQDAPEALGAWMLEALKAPQPTATDWKLDPDTPFFIGAVRASLAKARGVWGDDSRIAAFACDDLLGWRGLPINEFKEE